jgi:RHS repeat-associated protein
LAENSALAGRCRRGRLTRIDNALGSTHFEIDARGRRVRKSGPLGERQYHYDHAGRLLAESAPNGIHDREYIYLGELPVAAVADGALYHLDPDHLGTPRLATDGQGAAVWRWEGGEPFGAQAPDEDPGRTGNRFVLNLRFPGQYYDQETQLHYNYFRDYDPATGRYVQSDPIGLAGGINTYGYVGGNPVSYIDPRGLETTVTLYPGASGFGHVGIGINTSNTSGYYPVPSANSLSVAAGQSVPGVVLPDLKSPMQTITLPTTPAQEQKMRNALSRISENPGSYNLYGANCATTVQAVLSAGGINCPQTILPRKLIQNLQAGQCR